jgi:hypothetical protein
LLTVLSYLSVSPCFLLVLSLLQGHHVLSLQHSISIGTLTFLIRGIKLRKLLIYHLAPLNITLNLIGQIHTKS